LLEPDPDLRATVQAAIVNTASRHLQQLNRAERLILAGAAIAVLCFFLPWAAVPSDVALSAGMSGARAEILQSSFSGARLFQFLGAWFLLFPAAAVAAAVLAFSFRKAAYATRCVAAGWQIFLAAPAVISTLAVFFVPMVPSILQFGYYGFSLGFLGILIGSFWMLSQIAHEGETGIAPQHG
jgi:hypothetical protein